MPTGITDARESGKNSIAHSFQTPQNIPWKDNIAKIYLLVQLVLLLLDQISGQEYFQLKKDIWGKKAKKPLKYFKPVI